MKFEIKIPEKRRSADDYSEEFGLAKWDKFIMKKNQFLFKAFGWAIKPVMKFLCVLTGGPVITMVANGEGRYLDVPEDCNAGIGAEVCSSQINPFIAINRNDLRQFSESEICNWNMGPIHEKHFSDYDRWYSLMGKHAKE